MNTPMDISMNDPHEETPVVDLSPSAPILAWYAGKGLERARQILPALAQAQRDGFWPPKLSRTARAALTKQRVAEKFARANERAYNPDVKLRAGDSGLLEDIASIRGRLAHESKLRGWSLVHAMMFGRFDQAPDLVALADGLLPHVRGDAERAALATARRWAVDFTPLARLFAQLDATRPRPSYEFGEISSAVRANVQDAMKLSFETVRVPEIRWSKVQIQVKSLLVWGWVGTIRWPEGTRHGASKYGVSASGSDQCQACGHAIYDASNWCPLVLDGPGGPASLWVGRDCARHLFGCRVGGEGTFLR